MLTNREKLRRLGIFACDPYGEKKDICDADYQTLLKLFKISNEKEDKKWLFKKIKSQTRGLSNELGMMPIKSDTILLVEDLKLSEKLKKLTSNWRHR